MVKKRASQPFTRRTPKIIEGVCVAVVRAPEGIAIGLSGPSGASGS